MPFWDPSGPDILPTGSGCATELLRQPVFASFSQTHSTSPKKNQNGNVLLPLECPAEHVLKGLVTPVCQAMQLLGPSFQGNGMLDGTVSYLVMSLNKSQVKLNANT